MTYKIVTLGCKVNSYESSVLEKKLLEAGYNKDDINPTYIFLNTCAVTSTAEKQDRQTLRRLINKYPNSKIVVLGCSAQVNKDDYLSYKNVIKVRGSQNKTPIDDLNIGVKDDVNPSFRSFTYEDSSISKSAYPSKAYLKIQDGCDNFCSYCIVPYARGRSRSRNRKSIINEFKNYLDNGIKEIILGGIDVSSFDDDGYSLKDLLKELTSFDGEYRIRVSSIEISRIDEDYIKIFKDNKHLANHFHIPLQSGSTRILKLMNRKYTKEEFLNKVKLIKQILPDVALSSDVITGFPSETDEDFNDTIDVIKKVNFMKIHVFPYSERKGTKAVLLDGSIDKHIRSERLKIVEQLSKENQQNYFNEFKDIQQEILIERIIEDNIYGYSSNYLYLEAKNNNYKIGNLVKVSDFKLIEK